MGYSEAVDANLVALAVAGLLSWIFVVTIRRAVHNHELVEACGSHDRYLDEKCPIWAPTYRCRRCPWQAPAIDVLERMEREHVEAMLSKREDEDAQP